MCLPRTLLLFLALSFSTNRGSFPAPFCQLIRTNKGEAWLLSLVGSTSDWSTVLKPVLQPQDACRSTDFSILLPVCSCDSWLQYVYKKFSVSPVLRRQIHPQNVVLCASINLRLSQHFPQDYPRLQWVAFWPHGGSTGRLQRNMPICYLRSRLGGCDILAKFTTEPWFHAKSLVVCSHWYRKKPI